MKISTFDSHFLAIYSKEFDYQQAKIGLDNGLAQ